MAHPCDHGARWGTEWVKVVFMVVALSMHITSPAAISGFASKVIIKHDGRGYRVVAMVRKGVP